MNLNYYFWGVLWCYFEFENEYDFIEYFKLIFPLLLNKVEMFWSWCHTPNFATLFSLLIWMLIFNSSVYSFHIHFYHSFTITFSNKHHWFKGSYYLWCKASGSSLCHVFTILAQQWWLVYSLWINCCGTLIPRLWSLDFIMRQLILEIIIKIGFWWPFVI